MNKRRRRKVRSRHPTQRRHMGLRREKLRARRSRRLNPANQSGREKMLRRAKKQRHLAKKRTQRRNRRSSSASKSSKRSLSRERRGKCWPTCDSSKSWRGVSRSTNTRVLHERNTILRVMRERRREWNPSPISRRASTLSMRRMAARTRELGKELEEMARQQRLGVPRICFVVRSSRLLMQLLMPWRQKTAQLRTAARCRSISGSTSRTTTRREQTSSGEERRGTA
mmetsp:Transcript_36211/g.81532  ORF Transcript_36211/g.81532 Transcript_36211/m.81532 type:complete len:226 (-) Transcript_36211:1686-2363(-)